MKTLAQLSLKDLLANIRSWNNSDLRNIDEITPNRDMLLARRRVINELAKRLTPP